MVLFNVKLAVVSYVIDQLMVLFNVKLAVVSYVCCNIYEYNAFIYMYILYKARNCNTFRFHL